MKTSKTFDIASAKPARNLQRILQAIAGAPRL